MTPAAGTRAWVTDTPEATQELGAELAEELGPGDVVAFYGDLGSGKTCMIQGVCRGLGVSDAVTSPTFILLNEYVGCRDGASLPVYHFDLYRIRGRCELEDLGADEYLYGQGVCLIEWAEHAEGALPARRFELSLEQLGDAERRISLRRCEG